MNSVIDISWIQLAFFSLTLLIPLFISHHFNLGLRKDMLIAVTRMILQLILVGMYLEYLFKLNSILINTLWISIMVLIGASSVIGKAKLPIKRLFIPVAASIFLGMLPILGLLCLLVIKPSPWYNAQYLIPLAGMLLGNTLSSNIIALQNLFNSFEKRHDEYAAALSLGATAAYACRPFIQEALQKAMAPILASMATIGLVTLPGMMTGQILGGASPMIAIKYQSLIMIAIFVALNITLTLSMKLITTSVISKEGRILVRFK
jgi:putative ABC transport system permease protein